MTSTSAGSSLEPLRKQTLALTSNSLSSRSSKTSTFLRCREAWRSLKRLSTRSQTKLHSFRSTKTSLNSTRSPRWPVLFKLRSQLPKTRLSFSTTVKCLRTKSPRTTQRLESKIRSSSHSSTCGPPLISGASLTSHGCIIHSKSLMPESLTLLHLKTQPLPLRSCKGQRPCRRESQRVFFKAWPVASSLFSTSSLSEGHRRT